LSQDERFILKRFHKSFYPSFLRWRSLDVRTGPKTRKKKEKKQNNGCPGEDESTTILDAGRMANFSPCAASLRDPAAITPGHSLRGLSHEDAGEGPIYFTARVLFGFSKFRGPGEDENIHREQLSPGISLVAGHQHGCLRRFA